MNESESQLLNNLFDSLDRLFDNECKVIDLYHLALATKYAITKNYSELNLAIEDLNEIVKNNSDLNSQRESALTSTNELRILLNRIL